MRTETIKKRVSKVRGLLKKKRLDGLVVTRRANVTYLTSFSGDDSWALVTPRVTYLITDSRYTEQTARECRGCKIINRTGPMGSSVAGLINKYNTIGLEDSASIAAFYALKRSTSSHVKKVANIVESIRQSKDAAEVAAIHSSAKIAFKALGRALKQIRRGMMESDLAGIIDFELRKLGAYSSFQTVVAFGPNASRPHHQPGQRRLKANQPILIDWGAVYKGYCSDMTRCFVFGKVTRSYTRAYKAVYEAQQAAIKKLRAGVLIAEVDKAAREVIKAYGLPVYGHGTGHGIGLEIHEGPVISSQVKGRLQAGQVITIEPGVYIPSKLGIRIEDDVLVTNNGYRILTRSSSIKLPTPPYLSIP